MTRFGVFVLGGFSLWFVFQLEEQRPKKTTKRQRLFP